MSVKFNEFLILSKSKKFNFDSESFKYFLAGFVEGEGSLSVSIKSQPKLKHGFALDPEFFIYQHESGIFLLEAARSYFRAGSVYKKSGDSNVYVFRINNRQVLKEKVLPFFSKYVIPYSCKYKYYNEFCFILESLIQKKHTDQQEFLNLLKKVYELNSYSKGKEIKYTYDQIKEIILRDYTPNGKINKTE